jgi:hypothetical protein
LLPEHLRQTLGTIPNRRKRPPNDIDHRAYPQDFRSLLAASGRASDNGTPPPPRRAPQLLDVIEEAEHALFEQCRDAFVIVGAATSKSAIVRACSIDKARSVAADFSLHQQHPLRVNILD